MAKHPKTIQEQIDLLQSRNMAFREIANAPHFLANISYHIKQEILALFDEFNQVLLYKMGFPKGWEKQPVWKE